ncbi:unnamed protein product [Discula destructiva]
MQFSQRISLASLATLALAAPAVRCKSPSETTPTLPSTGSTDLPAPASGLTLKYLAVGQGLQNYTCATNTSTATSVGALAVLYDATELYSTPAYANLSSTILWNHAIPLNMKTPQAAGPPNSATAPVGFSETAFQADAADPFPENPAALTVEGISAPFLGLHYFDAQSSPTFDLSASEQRLFFSGAKSGDVKAPSTADKGLLATGAIDWLQLSDNGRGLSSGVTTVYRVVTAGGVAQLCSVSGPNPAGQVLSVPYVADYWFYG